MQTRIMLAFFLLPVWAFAQKPYFQQKVNYRIEVRLDDERHRLEGNISMDYHNLSPDTLTFVYMHLWANAYSSRTTAFARQQLRNGNTDFHFAQDTDRGGFSGLNFQVDGRRADWKADGENPDIAILELPEKLLPGGQMTIQTPFTLQIPASFSRLGHIGQSYQITQWFPKPAVYDREGWHPMPYLDQGEFYSEFGDFDVSITLPENYVVAATGILETAGERGFLVEKALETSTYLQRLGKNTAIDPDTFPPSSLRFKTIRYTAQNVHDFAWFADKRFRVQKSEVGLPSGKKVETWVMFTGTEQDLWKDAINYVNRSVSYFSTLVGEYPYPQVTAVQSALSAGAGMEYPMITVIGLSGDAASLEEVIAHEVAHNWFYGVLAFNERDHAWMDEGLTSYYEKRYMAHFLEFFPEEHFFPEFLKAGSMLSLGELSYLFLARRGLDQAPETTSDKLDAINYFVQAYEKPALLFRYLEHFLGQEKMDSMMQAFYQQWAFRHPGPADFQEHAENFSNQDLSWLFNGLIQTNRKVDYGIRRVLTGEKDSLLIVARNRGALATPFSLAGIRDGVTGQARWFSGFAGTRDITFSCGGCEAIVIDPLHSTPDLNRRDNHFQVKSAFPGWEPLQLGLGVGLENDRKTQLFLLPAVAWNKYDKVQLGLYAHNLTIPFPRLSFAILPLFATGSRSLTGLGNIMYQWNPERGPIRQIDAELNFRRFHDQYNPEGDYFLDYRRWTPALRLHFRQRDAKMYRQSVTWRMLALREEVPTFDASGQFSGKKAERPMAHEWFYTGKYSHPLFPFQVRIALECWDQTSLGWQWKTSAELRQSFAYRADRYIHVRLFGGGFVSPFRATGLTLWPNAFSLSGQGFTDYRFEDFYFGRGQRQRLWAQQINLREGGMKYAFGSPYRLGRSNQYIFALNLHADLPLKWPVKPYFDLGYSGGNPDEPNLQIDDPWLWSGGLALSFWDQRIGVYFPIVSSPNIRQTYQQVGGGYLRKIAFNLDISRFRLREIVEDLRLW